jgi:L-2-hydroxyglutarate oxidase LhgO
MHTSSRNSEVIHAGFYYPTGTWKARLCVPGRDLLYAYCAAHDVPHRRVGKIVCATTEAEVGALEKYKKQGEANGVTDLTWLDAAEVAKLEPEVRCVRALQSPSTGIIDSHGLMQAYERDLRDAGGAVLLSTPVLGGSVQGGLTLEVGGQAPSTFRCKTLVNSAGLWAPAVAQTLRGLPAETIPVATYAKGHYFMLSGRSPFKRLVYPIAVAGGLGVHVTLDLAGRARFGPDVSWIDGVDYAFDEARGAAFYEAIRRYWPGLPDGALEPGYTGIRPKLGEKGAASQDFVIQGPDVHGVPGLVNLYGIESPGLTASLALADVVIKLLGANGGAPATDVRR